MLHYSGLEIIKYALINNNSLGNIKMWCCINSYHGNNYYEGPVNIKYRCIIMILLNNSHEIGTKY